MLSSHSSISRRVQRYLDVRSVEDAEFTLRHIPLALCAWSASAGLRVLEFGSQDLRPIVVGSVVRRAFNTDPSDTIFWMVQLELARNGDVERYHRVLRKASMSPTSRTSLAPCRMSLTLMCRAVACVAKLPFFFEGWIHPNLNEDGVRNRPPFCPWLETVPDSLLMPQHFPKICLSLKRVGCHSVPLRFEDIRLHDVVRLECRVRDDDSREISPRVWFEIERLDVIAREPGPVGDLHDVDAVGE